MRVDLDAKVHSSDGEELGSVERAVFDPDSKQVRELVVSTGGLLGRDVLVPVGALDQQGPGGDRIVLKLTRAEVETLPPFVEATYMPPPPGWIPPGDLGLAYGSYLWPAAGAAPMVAPTMAPVDPNAPQSETFTIGKGAVVMDANGDDVGVVDDVRFEASSGELEGFVLRLGGVLTTLFGGGDTVTVTREDVERVAEGAVYLRIGREGIEALARGAG
jgi:sporulation protein YlmC with PRC-barrel domain